MRVVYGIMASEPRNHMVYNLQGRLATGRAPTEPYVITEWSNGRSAWDTGAELWMKLAERNPDYAVVLQDDALPCKRFTESVDLVLRHLPFEYPLSFYLGTVRPNEPHVRHAVKAVRELEDAGVRVPFLQTSYLHHGVAVCLPGKYIVPAIHFGDQRHQVSDYAIRLGKYFHSQRIPTLYTNPSLVEHLSTPSLIHRNDPRDKPRVAHNFIGTEHSGLELEWRGQVNRITGI